MAPIPLFLEVFDKAFKPVGQVGDAKFITVIPRHCSAIGQATFAVRANHRRVPDLVADGARVRVLNAEGEHLMSGRVTRVRGSGPSRRSLLEFDVVDDLDILRHVLGWVQPAQAITNQGTAGTNWTMTGAAESVLKAAVTANAVNRLGLPIIVPATQGRGATVKASLRNQPLYDRLFPVEDGAGIEAAGINVEMKLIPRTGILLDVSVPTVRPQPLTELGGVIQNWEFSRQAATKTRGVVGGGGEGTLRLWREKSDPALEALLGWKYEFYRDARDTTDPTVMYSRLDETLLENAAKAGISFELAERSTFRYGQHVKVGDTVTLEVAGQAFTERLQEVTLSWTASGGFVSRPRVGDHSDSTDVKLGEAIRKITRSLRNRNTET